LLAYTDGARNDDDVPLVNEVRRLIRTVDWTHVELVERPENFGCARNIIEGLSETLAYFNRATVMEDDVLPSATLYQSLLLLLDHYEDVGQVFSVGGFPHLKTNALPGYPYDVILSPRLSIWGWGTWADRWQSVVGDLKEFENPYGSPGRVPLYAGMDLPNGARAIELRPHFYWDLPMALLCLHNGFLHALTRFYLVQNIGLASGTHGFVNERVVAFMRQNNRLADRVPVKFAPVIRQPEVCAAVQQYVREITMKVNQPEPRITARRAVKKLVNCLRIPFRTGY
jgi:hypothetical protein